MVDELELTTAICLFHHVEKAEAAVNELRALGIPASEIAVVGDAHKLGAGDASPATLRSLLVPEDDIEILMDGLNGGGTIVAVRTTQEVAGRVEKVFEGQSAELLDEHVFETNAGENGTQNADARQDADAVKAVRSETDPAGNTSEESIDAIDPLNRVD